MTRYLNCVIITYCACTNVFFGPYFSPSLARSVPCVFRSFRSWGWWVRWGVNSGQTPLKGRWVYGEPTQLFSCSQLCTSRRMRTWNWDTLFSLTALKMGGRERRRRRLRRFTFCLRFFLCVNQPNKPWNATSERTKGVCWGGKYTIQLSKEVRLFVWQLLVVRVWKDWDISKHLRWDYGIIYVFHMIGILHNG